MRPTCTARATVDCSREAVGSKTARAMLLGSVLAWSGCNSIMGYEAGASSETAAVGGSGTGGASAGGGGSSAGAESCLDRVDNNGDGLADCEDPLCQVDHQCVPLTAGDWLGVGWLYEGAPAADCPLGQRLELYDEADLVVPDATCTCGCDAPTTTVCSATLSCSTFSCGGAQYMSEPALATCTPLVLDSANLECQARSLHAVAGPCSVAGVRSGADVEWPATASACVHAPGGHCPGQASCVPQATESAQGPCVARSGEHSCPDEYPDQQLYWDGTVDDGRSCDAHACSCGSASGASCACTADPCGVRAYHDDSCSGSWDLATMDGATCADYSGLSGAPPWNLSTQLQGATVSDPGSCTPTGTSQLQGEVTPLARVTVCCATE